MDDELFAFAAGLESGVRVSDGADRPSKKAKKHRKADPSNTAAADAGPAGSDERAKALSALADVGFGGDVGHGDARRRIDDISHSRRTEVLQPLAAPAQREREDRAAAYSAVARDASKWAAVMRRNRTAEHRVFGQTDGAQRASAGVADVLSGEAPGPAKSALAADMARVLQRASLHTEEHQLAAERRRLGDAPKLGVHGVDAPSGSDAHENDSPPATLGDDEDARIAALAKRRALVLWTEQKRRQQARIKSKSFRRHVRREEAAIERKTQTGERDFDADLARARERVSLKTRRAGKWAAAQLSGRRVLDARVRDEAVAQVREKERLRQEIYGRAAESGAEEEQSSDGGSDASDSGSLDSDPEESRADEVDAIFDAAAPESSGDEISGRKVFSGAGRTSGEARDEKADPQGGEPVRGGATFGESSLSKAAQPASDEQMRLVREAFEGDDVFEAFAAHKAAVVAEEAPRTLDETLPGWGSWAGANTSAPAPRVVRRVPGVSPPERRDAHLANVVVREARSRRCASLLAVAVPYRFGGARDAYEAEMAAPVGAEWTGATAFSRRIRPRVVAVPGRIIAPARPSDAEAEQ